MTVEGYRSFKEISALHFDRHVTVVLGPNDHGKSNLLRAITHLNSDTPFDAAHDLNWDATDGSSFPAITYELELTEPERKLILEKELKVFEAGHAGAEEDVEEEEEEEEQATGQEEIVPTSESAPTLEQIPTTLIISRAGIEADLECKSNPSLDDSTIEYLMENMLPRVELIVPSSSIPDSVTAEQLAKSSHEFMRGIFYYAGLDPDDAKLFVQNDRTTKTLQKASKALNETLRKSWSQGSQLEFELQHDSKNAAIDLKISDPAVSGQYVRASRRSSGFTHYFSTKTVLYARQKEHEANEYIWLFDEPGIYLHPSGQNDLLQVIEALSKTSQVLYATHSVFMINRNFPTRHRLITKGDRGTRINTKPHSGRWGAVLSAFGLSLTSPILFANNVLLAEGESDPIFILAVLQKLIQMENIEIDLNSFAAMSTGESRNADVMIRLLFESDSAPNVGMLFDGDGGGKSRKTDLSRLIDQYGIQTHTLVEGTTIEDHLIDVRGCYVDAVADYTAKLIVLHGEPAVERVPFRKKFHDHFDKTFESGKVTKGVATWANEACKEIATSLKNAPSKVGIAREYAELLATMPSENVPTSESRPAALAKKISEITKLPTTFAASEQITAE